MLALTFRSRLITLTVVKSKASRTDELAELSHLMVHGSLSEVTRQCGDPSCACATDPARRHGPHLYLKFTADAKAYSVYIPPEEQDALRQAHDAWRRFNSIAEQMAAENRQRLLQALEAFKQSAKAQRAKQRRKA
jgi:tRNA U34 5-methylaminomethyl-2-thiouridine-forming methyltransferase MnmC